ncbi:MAG: hypothetical protein B7X04_00570 [Parcubacteria group bacterium 21-54-25]|nr:MAG: hypothetical protein B7X04_00570 [Parcubacteria group bacterium 21-54-25]HQU07452.1 glycosyltransferase family 4 protein [Candidatus Paceibacterota bacterium]
MNKDARILFLFSGAANRRCIIEKISRGEDADTALRGLNYIDGAEYLDVEETVRSMLPAWVYRLLPWQMRSVVLFGRVRHYDVVFAQDDPVLGCLLSRLTRTRWVHIAINSSTLMRRHAKHPLRLALLKTFWRSFFRIVCISRAQLEDFAHRGISHKRLIFVPFGIDADFYANMDKSREESLILSVGRDLGRDYSTLIEAVKKSDRQFLIVTAHKNLPKETRLPSNVSVRYSLPLIQLRDLYARARLVVVASKDEREPVGSDCSGQTVILDAMAAGRPVIATDRAWIHDYFTVGKEILIVPPSDPKALTAAIERLWRDDALRESLARAGQKKVREKYTTRTFARALAMLIER